MQLVHAARSCSSHLHPLHDVVTVRQLTQVGRDAPQHTLDRLSQPPRHGGRVGEDGIDERPQCTGVGASHVFHVVCGDKVFVAADGVDLQDAG